MKKFLSTLLLMSLISFNAAIASEINATTNAQTTQQPVIAKLKDAKGEINLVRIYDNKTVLAKGNVIKIAFAQDFSTKNVKVGDKVNFILKKDLETTDGKIILPKDTQIIANVEYLEKAKSFNRNAKVLLSMGELMLPNGQTGTISAQVNTKNGILKRSGWNVFGKISAWTTGMLGVGAGLGAAIGAASSSICIACLAIGLPIGAGVGLIIGATTPGINYTVKPGKEIPVVLTEDLDIIINDTI